MNNNYSYFDNEAGDYTIAYKLGTDEEKMIAITETAEISDLICQCLNLYSNNPELLEGKI